MYEAAVLGTVIMMVISAADYTRRAWKRETNPVPATWILAVVMFSLSFWMYWASPRRSWTANIAVIAGLANTTAILIGVIAANIRYGTLRVAFDRTQRWCLAFGAAVVAFWWITDAPLVAYALVQVIGILAYTATVRRLWNAQRSTEPLLFWVAILLATLCAIYPAWTKHDPFSWIYLARAVPSTTFMVWLIMRAKRRMREPALSIVSKMP